MLISHAFPSKYISAPDLQGQIVAVTMSHVNMEDVGQGQQEQKPVLYFLGKQKGLVLNKTNANHIASLYGDDTTTWQGQPLELFVIMTEYQGQPKEGVRVRRPQQPVQSPSEIAAQNMAVQQGGQAQTENPAEGLDDEIPF